MKRALLLLFLFTALYSEDRFNSYVIPAVTTVNTGVERMWIWSGVSGGFVLGEHYRLGGEFYYWNRDEVTPGTTLQNRLHLFGTIYGTWEYQLRPLPALMLSAGFSVGYQYAEVDRNWDSTYVGAFRTDEGESYGTVPLNWEAESKIQSFGGPQFSVGFGLNRLFLSTRFRLNMGQCKKWGGYISNDPAVKEIHCGDGIYVGDVQVSEGGWQPYHTGVLHREFALLPEWQFGITLLL